MILFDVSCLNRRRISGIETYTKHLSSELMAEPQVEFKPVWRYSPLTRHRWIDYHCGQKAQPYIEMSLRFGKHQLFHGPNFRIPKERRHRKVVTVHDLSIFEPGMAEPLAAASKQALFREHIIRRRPDAILFPSEFSRQQFLKFFPDSPARLFVTPLGCDHLPATHHETKNLIGSPYILFVGNLEVRKNVSQIISTFEALKSRPYHSQLKLALVGHKGYGGNAIERQMRESKVAADILHLGFVHSGDLPALFQHALLFIYPSLYEGFGIPIIEAMKNGCPVLTSRESSTAEVAGDAAVTVDARNRDEIIEATHQLLMSQEQRQRLRELGLERAKQFTWRKCAEKTLQAYREII